MRRFAFITVALALSCSDKSEGDSPETVDSLSGNGAGSNTAPTGTVAPSTTAGPTDTSPTSMMTSKPVNTVPPAASTSASQVQPSVNPMPTLTTAPTPTPTPSMQGIGGGPGVAPAESSTPAAGGDGPAPSVTGEPTATTETGGAGPEGSGGSMGSGGEPATGMSAKDFTCTTVFGIDATSEWYMGGFETQIDNDKWQLIYFHPGFVEDWDNLDDDVWKQSPTSACTMNSTNPDRVIFNVFGDPSDNNFMSKDTWVTGLNKAIDNIKSKYSNIKRIDLLTMTRAPGNTPCDSSNRMSIVETYVDEAIAAVADANPDLVTAPQAFFAPNCDVYKDGGPHFTDAGKPIIAKLYGDYYAAEP
ncbi:MAG TPA: hypothetical protein VHM70_23275 [Polyangiaceae bacterium]|nr:hypothetical protein [Polyangiaceae bacterium]